MCNGLKEGREEESGDWITGRKVERVRVRDKKEKRCSQLRYLAV